MAWFEYNKHSNQPAILTLDLIPASIRGMNNVTAIPAFKDNYIWLIATENNHVIIVDPGDERPVLKYLQDNQLTPVAIVITHQCYDHVDGIMAILQQFEIPVYGPATERIPGITQRVKQGDLITINDTYQLKVLDVPGHTAGHVAYYQPALSGTPGGSLFCGDTLFGAGCGRLHTGLYDEMFHSLQKISSLPDETRIYCAHEYTQANLKFAHHLEPDNQDIRARIERTDAMRAQGEITIPLLLSDEKNTNPFLRCHIPTVAATAQHYAAENGLPSPTHPISTFRTIRYWKNQF